MHRRGRFGRAWRAAIVVFGGAAISLPLSVTPACGSDTCGCDDIRTYPGSAVQTAHRPLECLCPSAGSDCRQTQASYEASLCSGIDAGVAPAAVERATGCGMVALGPDIAFGGRILTFDAKTGALVGITDFSDANSGACGTHTYAYGTTLHNCFEKIDRCILCGTGTGVEQPCP